MLQGINKKIFDDIKYNLNPYFLREKGAANKLKSLLELKHEDYEKRQKIAEEIIKRQLFYHGKGKIYEFVAELSRIESVIMSLDKKLRDHIVHAVLTFIFGIYVKSKLPKWNICLDGYGDFPLRWKFCAPLHDIAYPIELFENLSKKWNEATIKIKKKVQKEGEKDPNGCKPGFIEKKVGGETSFEIIEEHNDLQNNKTAFGYIGQRLNDWNIDLDPENYVNWLRQNKISDHGVISSIVLLNIFDLIYQSHNPDRRKAYIEYKGRDFNQEYFEKDIVSSTSAIFIHNVHSTYLKNNPITIDFNKASLAYLLSLTDKLQEWERYLPNREIFSPTKFDIYIDDEKISISMDIPKITKEEIIKDIDLSLSGFKIEIK